MSSEAVAAVLGGTFDPFHRGHLAVVDQVHDRLGDEVWVVPARLPPHRRPAVAPPEQRLALARAATAGRPWVRVLDIEMRRAGPSYTIDTMEELGRLHPATELWVVLGADIAAAVSGWHRHGELLAGGRFLVVNRSGGPVLTPPELKRLGFPADRTRLLRIDSPAVSASEVRRRAAVGAPLDDLVPAPVAELISATGVYRSPM
ncbi:MAG: nicotinate (nicotinamide) nucleotide adenylyltransferase [Chloroflexi bacterium]|nr:MAG: nicotinate (nicotinamide) nucleotide adenylyltransferase [Chloroflexota bacterium]